MDFDNNLDKLTKNEFIKSFGQTIDNIYNHISDSNIHVSSAEREKWNNNSKLIPEYTGDGNSFFSESARRKLNSIESNANNYIHPTNTLAPGTYLDIHFDQYGHVDYVNNPTRIRAKVKNALSLNGTKSNGFLYARGSNFPREFNINTSYENMVDRSAVNIDYIENKTLDSAFVLGTDDGVINCDEHDKIYINTNTDTAYFYDGNDWIPLATGKSVRLDKDGYIPSSYIPSNTEFNEPVGEIAMCLSKRPPKGWVALDGSLYFRSDLPDLWEYAQNNGLVVSDSEWKTLYKNKNGNINYNIAAGLFSSGDGVNTFRVPSFFGETLYTKTLTDVGKTKNFTVRKLTGKLPAFYDESKTENLTYGNFSFANEELTNVPTIHPSRVEALASGISYENVLTTKTIPKLPYDRSVNLNGFVTLEPSKIVPVGNELRPRQVMTNFIIKASRLEENFPDKLYKSKPVNSNIDLSSYIIDIFNRNLIYSNESISEYIANHLYCKRFLFDFSHYKGGSIDFMDSTYALYSYLFSDIRVEFYNLSGISSINYPFSLTANEEFLTKLCIDNFITEAPVIDKDLYYLYNTDGEQDKTENDDSDKAPDETGEETPPVVKKQERPITQIINFGETQDINITIFPMFPTKYDETVIDYLRYGSKLRENTNLDIRTIYGTIYDDSFNISFNKKL